jgi:hypothetical protein
MSHNSHEGTKAQSFTKKNQNYFVNLSDFDSWWQKLVPFFSIGNFAEKMFSVLGADGNKIGCIICVIPMS